MIICFKDIPPEGMKIEREFPAKNINRRLRAGDYPDYVDEPFLDEIKECDVKFIAPLKAKITIEHIPNGFTVNGTVTSSYEQPCKYCLETITDTLKEIVDVQIYPIEIFNESDLFNSEDSELPEEDALDLEDIVQETVIFGINPWGSHHKECKKKFEEELKKMNKPLATMKDLLDKTTKG
ncbi:MAG: hypothetical protein D6780_07985 [Candidatus Dadabacteria bacterium]|nr:MAG: hypothetical protein D6780_07985 [Candidatus Dadabacteria bacterium]